MIDWMRRLYQEPDSVPWSNLPWNRCPARTGQGDRCDLRRGHYVAAINPWPHVAERGLMADIIWDEGFK